MKYFALLLMLITACQKPADAPIFQSEAFTVFPDKVVQGQNEAKALSRTQMQSNYQSPANMAYSQVVDFKFSLNQKDNELPVGDNHRLVIEPTEGKFASPIIVFGQRDSAQHSGEGAKFLPPNTAFTIRLDLRPVLQQFKEKGFYQCFDGSMIAAADFKGVFVAGNSHPLSWDFVNLANNPSFQLKDGDGDGIYETTVVLNAYDASNFTSQSWQRSQDVSKYPQYESEQVLVDALYQLALEETALNSEADGTFRTGEAWPGVWTRDISYSVVLAYALADPERSKTSLRRKVKNGRIIQDTGSGGAWPVSSDRTTWALAAWEIYLTTGDMEWLKEVYPIIKASVADDAKVLAHPTGLRMGESSFLDWREQTYPRWMENADIYASLNLGTNAVHAQTHYILANMATLLGEDGGAFRATADQIAHSINEHFWMSDKGYHAQYMYGRGHLIRSPRFEALGSALSMIYGLMDGGKELQTLTKAPVMAYGVPTIYPQIPEMPPYHNNSVWPFVQAYWNWAAAKAGHGPALEQGLAGFYRSAAMFLTNKENFVASSGDFKGTQVNSNRQLWSVAGNMAMVYRVFFGISLEEEGMRFAPCVPKGYAGKRTLKNLKYRNATLQIEMEGYGNEIESFQIDGNTLPEPVFDASLTGAHQITIKLKDTDLGGKPIQVVPHLISPETPKAKLEGNVLQWDAVKQATAYMVYEDGKKVAETADLSYTVSGKGQYQVSAIGAEGVVSFACAPIEAGKADIVEMEQFVPPHPAKLIGYTGRGVVEVSKEKNVKIPFTLTVPQAGIYKIDIRYANGSGPWNTDNKCAQRSLWVKEQYAGTFVFPQRGKDEWSNWGYSNVLLVALEAGKNELQLSFEPWNENMDGQVNRALLDAIRIKP